MIRRGPNARGLESPTLHSTNNRIQSGPHQPSGRLCYERSFRIHRSMATEPNVFTSHGSPTSVSGRFVCGWMFGEVGYAGNRPSALEGANEFGFEIGPFVLPFEMICAERFMISWQGFK
ncbi:hypothetical protein ZHAS_00014222 [Anopheles sinensis]|uniref:Uncharacterized protein n=1 Tax=Anopheles sinensis TaxID=74873 RepID=A0A084W7M3_ANOSI|nr:hypothetical protein ZHAS_00014222 [Anopheles sinensis]